MQGETQASAPMLREGGWARVLLYEPETKGHHKVYLKYIDEAFALSGYEVVTVTRSFKRRPFDLVKLAREERCSLIFICTFSRMRLWIVLLGLYAKIHGIKIAGIYYLFNNLYGGWKSFVWRVMLQARLVHTVFVPDMELEANLSTQLAGRVLAIPDPWDSRRLYPMSASRKAGSELDRLRQEGVCALLLFGAISRSKGLDTILEALERWDYVARPGLRVVVAGKIESQCELLLEQWMREKPKLCDKVIVINRWINEDEIAEIYGACAYLCALYKRWPISISTAITGFAFGRPALVASFGMMGRAVKRHGVGLTCDPSSKDGVVGMLVDAYDMYFERRESYDEMVMAARALAEANRLDRFYDIIASWAADLVRQANPRLRGKA